jgi:hypothetical protein
MNDDEEKLGGNMKRKMLLKSVAISDECEWEAVRQSERRRGLGAMGRVTMLANHSTRI